MIQMRASMVLFILLYGENFLAATPVDFSTYRFGYNNRATFETLMRDLVSEFGYPATTAYGKNLQAKPNTIVIDEAEMDKYLKETNDPKEREAIARFILAHEYFHVALKHPYASDWRNMPKEIKIIGSYNEARKYMERQVDYLAAKYILKLGLPPEPVQKLFLAHPEFHGGEEYPDAKERAEILSFAKNPGMDTRYFDNPVIKCTFLLRDLAAKFP